MLRVSFLAPLRRTPFAALALTVGVVLALVVHWPALAGRVPFPADVVLAFPPWSPAGAPEIGVPSHAELGDVAVQMYAWRLFAQRSLAAGHLPLWNPHGLLGAPQLANGQSAVFWPLHWLDTLLPLPVSWTLGILLETALAFFFTALLAREVGCRASGALLAGVAFALSGFLVSWGLWPLADGARCLPLILYAVLRLDRRPSPPAVACAALALALPVVAGHPQMALYDFAAGAALAVFLAVRPRAAAEPSAARQLGAAAAAAALAVGLAAAQWVPTWEWIGQLVRPLGARFTSELPRTHLVAWLSRDLRASPNPLGIEVPEGAVYLGLTTLLLAPFAVLAARRRSAVFWVGLGLGGAAVAYGVPPFGALARVLPLLRGLPNQRLLLWPELALALLAGLGLTALLEPTDSPGRRRARRIAAISFLGLVAALGWATLRAPSAAFAGPRGLATSWALALASAVGIAWLVSPKWRARAATGWALAALVAVDLGHVAKGHVPAVEPQAIFPPAPVLELLQQRLETHAAAGQRFRVGFFGMVVPPNAGVAYGIDTVEGYDYVTRRTAALLAPLTGGVGWNDHLQLLPRALGHGPLLDLLAVRYLVAARGSEADAALAGDRGLRQMRTGGRVVVYENPDALPGAVIVPWSGIRVEPDPQATARELAAPDFDPRRSALVSTSPARPRAGARRESPALRLATERLGNGYRVRVAAPDRSLRVLAEQAYPGWRVQVDGHERPLLLVDRALQGVAVSRGEHTVEFVFEPASVRWGLRVSAVAAIAALLLAASGWRRLWRLRQGSGREAC